MSNDLLIKDTAPLAIPIEFERRMKMADEVEAEFIERLNANKTLLVDKMIEVATGIKYSLSGEDIVVIGEPNFEALKYLCEKMFNANKENGLLASNKESHINNLNLDSLNKNADGVNALGNMIKALADYSNVNTNNVVNIDNTNGEPTADNK